VADLPSAIAAAVAVRKARSGSLPGPIEPVKETAKLKEAVVYPEERAFRLWINSLSLTDTPALDNLYDGSRDGIVLLRVIQHIAKQTPGAPQDLVPWNIVAMDASVSAVAATAAAAAAAGTHVGAATGASTRLKQVANCNLAIEAAKVLTHNPLVNMAGVDIVDGKANLVLALVWQLMRAHLRCIIAKLLPHVKQDAVARGVLEKDSELDRVLLDWANRRVAVWCEKTAPKSDTPAEFCAIRRVLSFHDHVIGDGVYVLQLIQAVNSTSSRANNDDAVDWALVTPPSLCLGSREARLSNASYALSLCRKMGATIFLLPEDIVEKRPRMITTLLASLMVLDLSGRARTPTPSKRDISTSIS